MRTLSIDPAVVEVTVLTRGAGQVSIQLWDGDRIAAEAAGRSAHNPCSKALLDACDQLGVLVMDEYIDHWYIHKTEYDYVPYFGEWWRQDLRDMVDKDYNHPSVILYSTGNEVSETAQPKGIALTREMTDYLHRREQSERNNYILEHMLYQQKKQLEAEKETIELINVKCHDLKHQLAHLEDHIPQELIVDLGRTISICDLTAHTGNDVLDTLLTRKSLFFEQKQIRFDCIADGNSLSFMKPTDVYAMFGNALDNAMEAVEKMQDIERRYIGMKIWTNKGMVMIHIENYYDGELCIEGELPRTTKRDTRYHGFGMKSIKMIVDKYGGGYVDPYRRAVHHQHPDPNSYCTIAFRACLIIGKRPAGTTVCRFSNRPCSSVQLGVKNRQFRKCLLQNDDALLIVWAYSTLPSARHAKPAGRVDRSRQSMMKGGTATPAAANRRPIISIKGEETMKKKSNFKRLMCCLLAGVMVLSMLAGCNNSADPVTSDETQTDTPDPVTSTEPAAAEAGREAHSLNGAYNVFPGGEFYTSIMPYFAAQKLPGKAGSVSSAMTNFSIAVDENGDSIGGDRVATSYNSWKINDLWRGANDWDGFILTDFNVHVDKCFGMEDATVPERLLKILEAGVEAWGNLGGKYQEDIDTAMETYKLGVAELGQDGMDQILFDGTRHILDTLFNVGVVDHP